MKYILFIVGGLFIASSLIYGITKYSSLNDMKEDVEYWERSSIRHSDNYLIEGRYNSLNAAYKSELSMTITICISGIISGVFFLALGTIIDLLEKIYRRDSKLAFQNNQSIQPPA